MQHAERKITLYISHATAFDYQTELYIPLRSSKLNLLYNIILPHENSPQAFDSKITIQNADLIVAEVSYPSTGQGIELGWANLLHTPIVCLLKKAVTCSSSLNIITHNFLHYDNAAELIENLTHFIKCFKANLHTNKAEKY